MPRFAVRNPGRAGIAAFALSMTMAATLAACGGSSTKTSSSTPTTTASTAKYVSCLESHGIPSSAASQLASGGRRAFGGGNPPSAGGEGGAPPQGSAPSLPSGVTQSSLRTAMQACRTLDPNRGRFGGGGGFNSAAFAAYRNCLQLHGVTLPSGPGSGSTSSTSSASSSTTTGSGGRGFGGLDTSNPTVQAALQACASLRPARGGSTTTTTAAS